MTYQINAEGAGGREASAWAKVTRHDGKRSVLLTYKRAGTKAAAVADAIREVRMVRRMRALPR